VTWLPPTRRSFIIASVIPYVVRQGDHLQRLAYRMGFDANKVWNHPKNKDLRTLRGDPNILSPGDLLYVPEPDDAVKFSLAQGTTNDFVADIPTTKITIKFAVGGEPCANEPYQVTTSSSQTSGTTDGSGTVSFDIPVSETEATVVFPSRALSFPIHVGHLDPAATESGVTQRLTHLGYLPIPGAVSPEEAMTRALVLLQTDHGLKITGTLDDDTRAALVSAHGC
jgi:hypothetical protein